MKKKKKMNVPIRYVGYAAFTQANCFWRSRMTTGYWKTCRCKNLLYDAPRAFNISRPAIAWRHALHGGAEPPTILNQNEFTKRQISRVLIFGATSRRKNVSWFTRSFDNEFHARIQLFPARNTIPADWRAIKSGRETKIHPIFSNSTHTHVFLITRINRNIQDAPLRKSLQ